MWTGCFLMKNKKEDYLMAKYILELTEEQAKIVAQACEFFARIKMGQFNEIPFLLLANELSGNDYCTRRDIANKYSLDARKAIYPELQGIGHSYGAGKFADADRAFDVYQVLRHALGDPREPFQLGEPLPGCAKLEKHL